MKVLVACEESGRVRDAFIRRGHDAMSCDIVPSRSDGPHYEGDVRDILSDGWDLLIAFPPCTYLADIGNRWIQKEYHGHVGRRQDMRKSLSLFRALYDAPIPRVCIENPQMHKLAYETFGIKPSQIIQPWQFRDPYTKRTCLWLRGLPRLHPTMMFKPHTTPWVGGGGPRGRRGSQGTDRLAIAKTARHRSETFPGIARAMADQWGKLDSPPSSAYTTK